MCVYLCVCVCRCVIEGKDGCERDSFEWVLVRGGGGVNAWEGIKARE